MPNAQCPTEGRVQSLRLSPDLSRRSFSGNGSRVLCAAIPCEAVHVIAPVRHSSMERRGKKMPVHRSHIRA